MSLLQKSPIKENILQKRPMILSILPTVATPHVAGCKEFVGKSCPEQGCEETTGTMKDTIHVTYMQHMWYDSFIREKKDTNYVSHMHDTINVTHAWYDSFIREKKDTFHVAHMHDTINVTHEWYDSFIREKKDTFHFTHMHDTINVTHTHECDMNSVFLLTYECVTSHICMSHATHLDESCHTYEWVMSHICEGT